MTGRYNSLFSLDQTVLRALETGSVETQRLGKQNRRCSLTARC